MKLYSRLLRTLTTQEFNVVERLNPFYKDQVYSFYKEAELLLGNRIDKSLTDYLKDSQRMIRVSIPLKRDDGKLDNVYAYHIQHSSHIWPCQGGLKISKNISALTVEAQAFMVTLRNALSEIPLGGSKSGICIDKNKYSEHEITQLIQAFSNKLGKMGILGVNHDIIGPEMGISPIYSNALVDGLKSIDSELETNPYACVTGKSRDMGGINGREELPSYGVISILRILLDSEKFCRQYSIEKGLKNKRIIVQGFGNMGYWCSKLLEKEGALIVGIMENGISIHNSDGFIIDEVKAYFDKNKTLLGYSKVDLWYKNERAIEMLYLPCDILLPAATEFVISEGNAKKISAAMVVEIAGNALTYQAQKMLYESGIPIIPDLLANSSSGILSYIEWMKGKYHGSIEVKKLLASVKMVDSSVFGEAGKAQVTGEKEVVMKALESWVSRVTHDVLNYSQMENVNLKTAAYCLAIQRMNEYIDKLKLEKTF